MTDVRQETTTSAAEGSDWTVTQDRVPESGPTGGAGLRAALSFARRSWRGLTSMRTALILLFLLAIAAIPGSLLPQTKLNADKVQAYLQQHPTIGPMLERIGAFNVFASPWFSAIYLLLFISLVGCLLPRLRGHIVAIRRVPPDAPARLDRLPVSASGLELAGTPTEAAARLRSVLTARRYRTVVRPQPDGSVTVSAEKGYLKETGNLLFHFALLALLVGVAYGSWYGWHGGRLLVQGNDGFCNVVSQLDDVNLGARMGGADIEPFCLTLNGFHASYLSDGQPVAYSADVSYTVGRGNGPTKTDAVSVNHPLRLPRANVYLVGHGYAPVVKYTDKYGHSITEVTPFLPQDQNFTSTGAIAFPDVNVNPTTHSNIDPKTFVKEQVGFSGFFYPTAPAAGASDVAGSTFPAANDPLLVLVGYRGDLGLDGGVPHSVYSLNQAQIDSGALTAVNADSPLRLRPGQTGKLDDGSTVEFIGTQQFATFAMRYDPGQKYVLGGAIALVIGLLMSLTGRRRRVWFRVVPGASGDGRTVSSAAAGGLARAEYASFPIEFDGIVEAARSPLDRSSAAPDRAASDPAMSAALPPDGSSSAALPPDRSQGGT
jgi:cytochrome c biogenesis protein